MNTVSYELVITKSHYVPALDGGKGHYYSHKSVLKCDGWEDAECMRSAIDAVNEVSRDGEQRKVTVCFRVWASGKSILLPVHSITGDMIDTLQRVYLGMHTRPHKSDNGFHNIPLPPDFLDSVEDTLHRRLHSLDEVDHPQD